MYAKAATIVAVAALAEQATAFNSHRHLHNIDRRALEIDWVTVWETVYVTAGQEPTEAPVEDVTAITTNVPTVYSTSTVIVPTTSAAPVVNVPEPVNEETVPQVTITPTPAPVAPEATPEPAAEEETTPEETAGDAAVVNNPTVPTEGSDNSGSNEEQPAEESNSGENNQETPAPVATTTSTAAPAATSPSAGNGNTGSSPFSKRGIAFNDPSLMKAFDGACTNCGWTYNWGSSCNGYDSSLSYVPMLWGDLDMHTSHWFDDADAALASGSKALLSFNEPDIASQANMDAGSAAAAHAKYFKKYAGQTKIGAPAVSNSGQPGEGLQWLESFMSACDANSDCHVDFCPVHWYSEPQYADTLFTHIEKAHEVCGGRPIWLTEFAPLGSGSAVDDFVSTVIPQLDGIDYLEAYSYFMVSVGSMMSSTSSLSSVGQLYATV